MSLGLETDRTFRAARTISSNRLLDALLLAVIALVLSFPVLLWGPMPAAHDGEEHIMFSTNFAGQFWQGELYPRWLLNMNHGLGSPSMFVYPPFPSYVYTLLLPAAKMLHFNAFDAAEYLCLWASGLAAFLWLSTLASRRISLIVASLYMLLPYHLAVDFYRRSALSECWALTWMPLVLYFTAQLGNNKRTAIVGLGVAYALLIVSHLISVLLFSALPLALTLVAARPGQKVRSFLTLVAGLALGSGLSAAYLFPALAHARYFPVSVVGYLSNYSLVKHLLPFGKGFFKAITHGPGFVPAVSLCTITTVLFIAFCGAVALLQGPSSRRNQVLFWLGACAIPLFMMSSLSFRVWRALPLLLSAVQFPWRLNAILCIAALPLAAFGLSNLPRRAPFRFISLAVVVLFATSWLIGYGLAVKRYALPAFVNPPVNDGDGWFDAWKPAGLDERSALNASSGPRAWYRTEAGNHAPRVLLWSARHIELQTDCANCGPVMIHQFYFPEWRAELLPQGRPLGVHVALPEGLLELHVPSGAQRIRLEIPAGFLERAGYWVSILSVLVCAFLLALRVSPPDPTVARSTV